MKILVGWAMGLSMGGEASWAAHVPQSQTTQIIAQGHSPNTQAGESKQIIRVRVGESVEMFQVRGFDLRVFDSGGSGASPQPTRVRMSENGLASWNFRCEKGHVRAENTYARKMLVLQLPLKISTPAGFLSVDGKPFRDEIRVQAGARGCDVVNALDIEKYVAGLIAKEFSPKWAPEAVLAQIVAARTYAVYQMQAARKAGRFFDVENSIKDQVYESSATEDPRAVRWVNQSRGLILTSGKQSTEPLKAFYHSTCGGRTELPQSVWGKNYPGFGSRVRCPYCRSSPRYEWKIEMSDSKLVDLIRTHADESHSKNSQLARIVDRGALTQIELRRSPESGRVDTVETVWSVPGTGAVRLPISAPRWRGWLGVGEFRSTFFRVERTRRGWNFIGRGNGHGVGLCQWGAKVMGERGYTMQAILKYYYPDAKIRKIW